MSKPRIAVVGCGHLGRIHARLLSESDAAELVAVADPHESAREQVAEDCGVRATADFKDLFGEIDAAVVAAPTSLHHAITRRLIEAGIHVLVEKPLTPSHGESELLVQLAAKHNVVLAVGHVERFNPAFVAAEQQIRAPLYIEASRKRYEHIGRRIDETLKASERAILFISERHSLQFPQDTQIFSVSPPALDQIHRWLRERLETKPDQ